MNYLYAIAAVPGYEEETAGAHAVDPGYELKLIDVQLDMPYEVAYVKEYATEEQAQQAALEYYGLVEPFGFEEE